MASIPRPNITNGGSGNTGTTPVANSNAFPTPAPGQGFPSAPVAPPAAPTSAPVAPPAAGPVSAPAAAASGVVREKNRTQIINLDQLLTALVQANGSDLHLTVTSPPVIRVNGKMVKLPNQPVLTEDSLEPALLGVLHEDQRHRFEKEFELDFSHTVEGVARFRGNLFRQRGVIGAVFRVIPWEIKPLEALGLPPVINNFAAYPRGLVLVTGPTGSGKSTTLASIVDKANKTRDGHIITVEDPIEFLHSNQGCIVNQREVGPDTHSFTDALKHILRQDPDIILIGELRDLETISIGLTAAETGHLVFATLHTQSAQDTINRVIDVFPPSQQAQIRAQLAATLKGVVSQTLVPSIDGRGRVPACEIMIVNPAIATMIRRGETHQIPQALQSGGQQGMQTLNQHLARLIREKRISREEAEEISPDIKDLDALLSTGR